MGEWDTYKEALTHYNKDKEGQKVFMEGVLPGGTRMY
jgi:hypothetical protein